MNRFQITADIDVTLWLGVLTKYKRQSNKIEYTNFVDLRLSIDRRDYVLGRRPRGL